MSPTSGGWFRPDIEGMRAIAIGLVLLAHAGFRWAEGGYIGIDVFFVISGFLITSLLLRERERTGRIALPSFYARRIRRLLPGAATVLLFVVVCSAVLFSAVRNDVVADDVIASIFYFINWHLAAQSVDYFAQGFDASPVQHMWSLAVEEQYYLVWPGLMIGLTALAARVRVGTRTLLGVAVAMIGLASLVYSARFTFDSPSVAYFSTLTRVWELALGAFLAIVPLRRPGARAASALSFGGLAAIAASFLLLNESTPFPGLIALVPTLGCAAVLYAGMAPQTSAPMRMLATRPFQQTGRLSYSLYLWHWPAVIFAAAAFGGVSVWGGALVMALSFVPAALGYRYIEQPVRRSEFLTARPRRAVFVLVVGSGTATVAAVALATLPSSVPVAERVAGAQALERDRAVQQSADALRPDVTAAFEDRTKLVDDGCFIKLDAVEQGECAYGDLESRETVVLFGDSHGEQYFPALEALAERESWRLVALTKSFCSPAQIAQQHPYRDEPFTDCEEWRELTIDRILSEERPGIVFVGGSTSVTPVDEKGADLTGARAEKAMVEGFSSTLSTLSDAGAEVALLTDVPKSPFDIPDCISENPDRLHECTFPVPPSGPAVERRSVERVPGAKLIDFLPTVCALDVCRGVIGDAIVYRDRGHVTATFAATLAPVIEAQLRD